EVRHIAYIVDGVVPADVAAYDDTVVDPDRQVQIAEIEKTFLHIADAYPPIECGLLYLVGQEPVRYPYVSPVGRIVAVAVQYHNFIFAELPIRIRCQLLLVSEMIFISPFWKVFLGNETVSQRI